MPTVLGIPIRASNSTAVDRFGAQPTDLELLMALGSILAWLLAAWCLQILIKENLRLEARLREQLEAERLMWADANRKFRVEAERRLQQIPEEGEMEQGDEFEMMPEDDEGISDMEGDLRDAMADELNDREESDVEDGMEMVRMPGRRQEPDREDGHFWRW